MRRRHRERRIFCLPLCNRAPALAPVSISLGTLTRLHEGRLSRCTWHYQRDAISVIAKGATVQALNLNVQLPCLGSSKVA